MMIAIAKMFFMAQWGSKSNREGMIVIKSSSICGYARFHSSQKQKKILWKTNALYEVEGPLDAPPILGALFD